ncbi:hypothetical protein FO519_003095 [Halicephalobus sp. NKZ332]|nr:hypothetical protein FO519_003095 [Halicephalobus sp. NKZ332]
MDNNASRPTNNTVSSASRIKLDRQNEKLIRHKLFLLSCDKLAALRQCSSGNALQRNLAILGVCRKTKALEYYPMNECISLLTERDRNTTDGPLFARRSSSSRGQVQVATPNSISPSQAAPDGFIFVPEFETYVSEERSESDMEIDFGPAENKENKNFSEDDMEMDFSHGFEAGKKEPRNFDESSIFEYTVKDSGKFYENRFDAVEEGADALEMLEEDGTSMARKRKSRQVKIIAEKRHCDEEVSPMSVTAPIPIPRPPKKPDQVVLDTLVPLRGFFQFRQ